MAINKYFYKIPELFYCGDVRVAVTFSETAAVRKTNSRPSDRFPTALVNSHQRKLETQSEKA